MRFSTVDDTVRARLDLSSSAGGALWLRLRFLPRFLGAANVDGSCAERADQRHLMSSP